MMEFDNSVSETSQSLLLRIKRNRSDQAAWQEFVDRYENRIRSWCVSRGLQRTDADDITQNVMLKLAKNLEQFDYDPTLSFRGWLRRVTENAVFDFFRKRQIDDLVNGYGHPPSLYEPEAKKDLVQRISEAFDLELLDEAKARVQLRVKKERWLAWQMLAEMGFSGEEAGQKLDMKTASVYTAKNQVQKLIQEELDLLERKD